MRREGKREKIIREAIPLSNIKPNSAKRQARNSEIEK